MEKKCMRGSTPFSCLYNVMECIYYHPRLGCMLPLDETLVKPITVKEAT